MVARRWLWKNASNIAGERKDMAAGYGQTLCCFGLSESANVSRLIKAVRKRYFSAWVIVKLLKRHLFRGALLGYDVGLK